MTVVDTPLWRMILVAAVAALAVAFLGGLMTDIGPWYQSLAKASWQPPGWLFGPVWTLIFALVSLAGVSAWRRTRRERDRQTVLLLFLVNGFLNVLWSLLFFRLQRPDWALVEVMALWLSILALIILLRRYSRVAGWLLLPYLLWVSFAAYLNWTIVQLNAPFGG
ncbi:TspO/MBR related protein [Dongia mobilis]|uniref:TspO/MBR related protein n=1 Tax=Dongia mobilis TaxID=578943 RepID=A0A4R6WP35_9PROT|nr:TspO/MBR family protein [Dongia mobilis]TDQ82944.1 TspO/MBR related protein [Dongia mobilis]